MDSLINAFDTLNVIHSLNIHYEFKYLIDILDDYEDFDKNIERYYRYINSNFFQHYNYNDIVARIRYILDNKYKEFDLSHFIYNLDMDICSILSNF